MQCLMGRQHVCPFLFIIHLCRSRKIQLCVVKMVLVWVQSSHLQPSMLGLRMSNKTEVQLEAPRESES